MNSKVLVILFALLMSGSILAQNKTAMNLVEKYSGKEGFTTITISKSLFRMLSKVDTKDPEYKKIKQFSNRLDDFKILIGEGKSNGFQKEIQNLTNQLNSKNGYEELLSIQESANSLVRISAKEKNDSIQELILSVVDGDEQMLMVINGNFTLDELMEISDDVEIGGLDQIKKSK